MFPINPDYNKPVLDLYRDVTGLMLLNANYLGLLSQMGPTWRRKMKRLQSWIPDYSTPNPSTAGVFSQNGGEVFKAAGETAVAVKWTMVSSLLLLYGHALDEIRYPRFT